MYDIKDDSIRSIVLSLWRGTLELRKGIDFSINLQTIPNT
jgi:hypothetical protein